MGISNPQLEQQLRLGFKKFNLFMVWMWRLGLGRWVNIWPSVGGRIMVITHTGRKTGLLRRTPVNYVRDGEVVYLTAGFGRKSDWYHNLLSNSEVEVWLPEGRWRGVAEDISDDPQRLSRLRDVIRASGFAGWIVGLDPDRMSDPEFHQLTADYRLLRIHLGDPVVGPGGPGDMAWLWIPIGVIGLTLLLLLRKRKSKPTR